MTMIDEWPTLATERLTLRAPRLTDAARIAELADDIDVARMTTRMPHPYDIEDAEVFLERALAGDSAREALFAITREGEGLIGLVGLYPSDGPGPEIGYWIGRPYWGQGFATEAARAAVRWAGEDWRRRAVVAGHFEDNPESGWVLTKAGFLYTGEVQMRHSMARGALAATRMMVWLA